MVDNRFQVADWQVDPSTCQISLKDEIVKLEPKVMELLVYMAKHPNEVLSRNELLDEVWADMVVGYEALTNAIIKLRKAFADDARHPRVIETFHKKGYRLIAAVSRTQLSRTLDLPQESTGRDFKSGFSGKLKLGVAISLVASLALIIWMAFEYSNARKQMQTTTHLELPEKPSIAVLPFVNTGNEAEYSYFSDGITDDLITDLSRLSGLFVISRNSTFQYKGRAVDSREVANTLGVRYILEGAVRRSGNRVRINSQLIDGISGVQIWAERYDGDLEHVFELQDRVTQKIINALAMQLSESELRELTSAETSIPAAYDEFLRGWERHWRFSRSDFAQAELHFRRALQIDPNYTRANAALALIYWQAWEQKWHENVGGAVFAGWARARQELEAAMAKPVPLVFSIKSEMLLHNRDYDQAITEAKKAIDLNPNNATGYLALAEVLSYMGRSEEAIENAKLAMRLDPNFPAPYLSVLGRAQFDMTQYQEAVITLNRAALVNPRDRRPFIVLIAALGQLGTKKQAQPLINQVNQQQIKENMRPLTIDWLKNRWPYQSHVDRERFIEGLKKAGVPDW